MGVVNPCPLVSVVCPRQGVIGSVMSWLSKPFRGNAAPADGEQEGEGNDNKEEEREEEGQGEQAEEVKYA